VPSPAYFLTHSAHADLREIIRWSLDEFGRDAAVRYNHLMFSGFREIAANPELPASRAFEKGAVRLFHLRHCRDREVSGRGGVKMPRHFIAYRRSASGGVEILRVLHDRMDLGRHLET
jgi:toxin ParE1/3/4